MNPHADPLVTPHPRSAAEIAAVLQRLLEDAGFGPAGSDSLRDALVAVAARDGEIVTACINAAPELHLRAFSEILGGTARPAAAAHVHLAFKAAPGISPVVVPMNTRVAAAAIDGDTAPIVFETSADLELVRADAVQAWFVDAGHLHVADLASMLAAPGRGVGDPLAAALPVVHAWHIAARDGFGLPGLREARLQLSIGAESSRDPAWQLDWGIAAPKGFMPLVVRSDTTEQLAHDGEIVFQPPPVWPMVVLEGIESRWLTARLRIAPLAAPSAAAPRAPRVKTIALRLSAATEPQSVGAACHGALPLDTSKDFFPFGERPRFGEVFHVLCPALVQPGAHIELRVQMTNPHGAASSPIQPVSRDGKPTVAWEVFTPSGTRALAATDGTRSLTADGSITFTVPADAASTMIAGKSGAWLRARLASGHFGSVVATDGSGQVLPCAPAIRTLSVVVTLERGPLAPDHIVCQGALTTSVLDAPFTQPFDIVGTPDVDGPALYIGLAATGSATGSAFAGALASGRVLSLHVRPAPPALPMVLDDARATAAANPRWQVRGATAWHDAAVQDTSKGLTRSGIVRLRLDHDAAPWSGSALDPNARCAWLRVAWPAPVDAARVLPIGVALNGVPATHTQRLRNDVLGSSNGRAAQVFKALRTPIIGDVLLQVREPHDQLVAWNEVGTLSASLPAARDFTLDRSSGEVRFGNGRQGRIPPAGANNIRLHEYTAGGGRQGNRPALAIARLRSALPAVEAVVNLDPASGGLDAETAAEVHAHASAWLRHRDRAVCADDYADLARKASPAVARAYCFGSRDLAAPPAPTPRAAEPEAGVISVMIVPQADLPRPQPSLDLLALVKAFLDARRAPAGRLVLVGPTYASVSVKATISVERGWSPHAVAEDCQQRIARFLHPLEGGADGSGWAPDKRPHRSDFFALIGAIDGVDVVQSVALRIDASGAVPLIVAAGDIGVAVTK